VCHFNRTSLHPFAVSYDSEPVDLDSAAQSISESLIALERRQSCLGTMKEQVGHIESLTLNICDLDVDGTVKR